MSVRFLPSSEDIDEALRTVDKAFPPPPHERSTFPIRPACDLSEVARELGVSRQRIAQIEKAALAKCRRWAAERGLRLEDLLG